MDENEPANAPLQWRLIARIFSLLRPYRRKRNWLLLCVTLRAVQQPAFAWAVAAIIDGPIRRAAPFEELAWACGGLLLLAFSMQLTLHFRQRLTLELGESVVNDLRRAVFSHLQRMPMSYFHKTKVGRILSRISGDCNAVRVGVQDVLFVSLIGLGQMTLAAAVMAYYSLTLLGVILAMTPIFALLNRVFRKRLGQAYRQVQENFSRVTAWLAEQMAGVRVTTSYDRGGKNADMFRTMIRNHANYNMAAARISGTFLPLIELNSQVFLAALIAIGGTLALDPGSATSLGDMIQFFFLANIFFGPIQTLASQYNDALTAMAGAERVFGLLDSPADPVEATAVVSVPRLSGEVEFDRVTFAYQPGRTVVSDISFRIEPGQTLALVGPSGGGKSTIAHLASRFQVADCGAVRIGGHDVTTLTRDTIARNVAVIPQLNYLFSGTLAENLRLGLSDCSDRELWDALEELDCAELVSRFAEGLETPIGPGGATLSLGERQLICLTRSLLVKPSLLILDEATASIDLRTERRLQRAIERVQRGRSTLIIAHRLSTIRAADQILVVNEGRIVERGRHNELAHAGGLYSDLLRRYSEVAA